MLPLASPIASGLGLGGMAAICAAHDVPSLATIGDVAACLVREHECRVEQLLETQIPRLREWIAEGGTLSLEGSDTAEVVTLDDAGLAAGEMRVEPGDNSSVTSIGGPIVLTGIETVENTLIEAGFTVMGNPATGVVTFARP